jgi:hypothetical protein
MHQMRVTEVEQLPQIQVGRTSACECAPQPPDSALQVSASIAAEPRFASP